MKKILIASVLIIPLALGGWFYHWWNQATSTNKVSIVRQADEDVLGADTTITSWSTPFFTTGYPDTFRLRTTNEVAHANMVGRYMFSSVSADKTDQIGVTVGHIVDGALTDLSAIQLRMLHPDIYETTNPGYAPPGSIVFNRRDGTETAVFMQDGDTYAAIVVSGSVTRQQILEEALQALVTNWQWQ